ncbi:porin [Aeromonas veronii]|uniref:porin n=1 Tax=Aeromonas veronii TaxID=654 RepID=UPI0030D92036
MKKSMLALILPALLGTGSAHAAVIYQADDGSNVDLYGRLGFNISDKKSGNEQGDFDGRIGFTARQTINDDVAVIGMAQYQVNAAEYANNVQKNSSDLTARYVWAGIDGGQWGKVTGGRVSSGLIMFTDIGDVFAASDVSMARQASKVDSTAVQVFRQDGTLQYQNTLGNLDLSLAYILGNGTSDLDYGYNGALRYTFDLGNAGKLAPVMAYQQTKAAQSSDSKVDPNADEYRFAGIGTRYYLGPLMLGALYSKDQVTYRDGRADSEDKVWELTAVYDINQKWAARAGYRHLVNEGGDQMALRDTTLELQYKLTPRSSLYSAYVIRNGEDGLAGSTITSFGGSSNSESFYHLGLRYEF